MIEELCYFILFCFGSKLSLLNACLTSMTKADCNSGSSYFVALLFLDDYCLETCTFSFNVSHK